MERKTNLKNVAIFSIIGSLLMMISAFVGIGGAASQTEDFKELMDDQVEETLESLRDAGTSEIDIELTEAKIQSELDQYFTESILKTLSNIGGFGNLITLVGAIFLFMRKKIGLHLYIAGTLFLIIGYAIAVGSSVFWIAFIIFYILCGLIFGTYYIARRRFLS